MCSFLSKTVIHRSVEEVYLKPTPNMYNIKSKRINVKCPVCSPSSKSISSAVCQVVVEKDKTKNQRDQFIESQKILRKGKDCYIALKKNKRKPFGRQIRID